MMMQKDISGQRFGRLTVVALLRTGGQGGHADWECLCDCGIRTIVRGTKLRQGRIKSCGCWRADGSVAALRADRLTAKRARARELRRVGLTYREIGEQMGGITSEAARVLCHPQRRGRKEWVKKLARCACSRYAGSYAAKIGHVCG